MRRSVVMSRLFALTLLLLPATAAGWPLYAYSLQFRMRASEIVAQRLSLGRLEALIARKHEIASLLATQKSGNIDRFFFPAEDTALSTARLQRQLMSIVAGNQARFIRSAEIPARDRNGLKFGGIRVELSGSIKSLGQTLEAIESAVPFLLVERAQLVANQPSGDSHQEPVLALSLEVYGAISEAAPESERKTQ
jgi:hypothetical protein